MNCGIFTQLIGMQMGMKYLYQAMTQMNLRIVMLSEKKQTKKNSYYKTPSIKKKSKNENWCIMREKHQGLLEGGGMREGWRDPKRAWGNLGLDGLFPILIVVLVSQVCVCVSVCLSVCLCVCVKTYPIVSRRKGGRKIGLARHAWMWDGYFKRGNFWAPVSLSTHVHASV